MSGQCGQVPGSRGWPFQIDAGVVVHQFDLAHGLIAAHVAGRASVGDRSPAWSRRSEVGDLLFVSGPSWPGRAKVRFKLDAGIRSSSRA